MAGTYSQIYIHIVIVVKYRKYLIKPEWEDELYKYITGIIKGKNQLLIEINGMPDHTHILIGMKPSMRLDDLVREIKKIRYSFYSTKKVWQQAISMAGWLWCIFS